MKTEQVQMLTETFEGHAQQTEGGVEYWLARDVQHLLGYTKWENFLNVVNKAKTSCDFAVQTRKAELIEQRLLEAERVQARRKLSATENELSLVIYEQTGGNQDFALIRSKGGQALFGKSTQAMNAKWKVPESRPLADFAPTILLKAKDFATKITIFNARQHQMDSERAISS